MEYKQNRDVPYNIKVDRNRYKFADSLNLTICNVKKLSMIFLEFDENIHFHDCFLTDIKNWYIIPFRVLIGE